jgi:tetratricopeptide (TPR) repeat protein
MRGILVAIFITFVIAGSGMRARALQDPAQAVQSLLAEAREAQARGNFADAAVSYHKAVELEPSIPELWANLGLMYHQLGKPTEAIHSFKQAARLDSSLFVPQLFLGIEYLAAKDPAAAQPYLETAEKLRPGDLQAALSLGSAYEMLDRPDRAAEVYLRATELAPKNGNAWLDLGTAHLQQVENDARVMTSAYRNSAYVMLRAAETLADEGILNAAENWYKQAIASASPSPCAHAEYGITLLRLKRAADAEAQFHLEERAASPCGLARLGIAVAAAAEGEPDVALAKLTPIATADPAFVQASLPLFRGILTEDEARSLLSLARQRQGTGNPVNNIASLLETGFTSGGVSQPAGIIEDPNLQTDRASKTGNPAQLYATGQYTQCDHALKPAIAQFTAAQQRLLASCSFYAGDFVTTSMAAAHLKTNPTTRLEGLYWESKADEKLAVAALARAGEIEPDSARMHVLLGDIYRQKGRWSEAEAEYRKAVDLDPRNRAARLSLAIVLFTEMKTDEAMEIDQSLLRQVPEDPEANLLAGEILVQEHHFKESEPYLSRCKNLAPDLVPRLHLLLGQIYAATNRVTEAISEYKLGLAGDRDEDGKAHYQLARLYEKSGDKQAAAEEFRMSQQLRRQWDEQAKIDLGQLSAEGGSP